MYIQLCLKVLNRDEWTTTIPTIETNLDFVRRIPCFFFFFERIEYKNVSKKTSKFFVHDHFTSHLSPSLIPFRDVVTRFEHRFEPQFDQRARIAFFLGYTFLCKQPYIYVHNYPPLFANLSEYYIYNMDIFETVYGTFTERKKKEKKERETIEIEILIHCQKTRWRAREELFVTRKTVIKPMRRVYQKFHA